MLNTWLCVTSGILANRRGPKSRLVTAIRIAQLSARAWAICFAGFFASSLYSSSVALAQSSAQVYSIDGVQIDGNRRVDTSAIVAQLSHQSGSITDTLITSEVKALYRTGFFSQVSAEIIADPQKPSRKLVKYSVVEKPVIRKVFIKGNKEVSESDLKEIFKFGSNRFLDRSRIFALTKSAISYYQQKGFYDAAFDYSVTPVGDNQIDLILTVTEGARYKIRSVVFRGLKDVTETDLQQVAQTKRYKWWNSWLFGTGRLNQEMLNNDKALIRQFFLDQGYIDATLSDPVIEAKDGDIRIAFNVDEGTQYKIGALTFSGDTLPDATRDPLEGIKSKAGEVFNASAIREDSFAISDKFTDVGYAFANVVPETKIDRQKGSVDINFTASKGKVVGIKRINIRGNDKTYDHVIRREMVIDEQDQFSSSKIKRSQKLLERLGYFEEVSITSEPADQDDQVNLNVNVREGATGTFSAGAGYSSSDGPLINGRISENNLFGTGRSLSLNIDLGTEYDNATINFTDRRINDSYWYGSTNLFRTFREFQDFDRVLAGGSVEVGYPLERVFGETFQDIQFSEEYEYLDINIKNVNKDSAAQLVIDSEGTSTSSSLTSKLVRNTINNPLDPRDGSRQILSFETSGLGGSEKYYLIEARQQMFIPLLDSAQDFTDLTFSWRTNVAYGESYDDEPFPLFKRYFPGGINSVRGFKSRSLGPKDERGNEYGGSKELVNNLELLVPIAKSAGLKGVFFYDAGQAFDDDEEIAIDKLRQAYGAGIRWNSPLGPIRVEFGFPIDREEGESKMVTMFAFGAPF
jgi:outer membrane protein insertion porin family